MYAYVQNETVIGVVVVVVVVVVVCCFAINSVVGCWSAKYRNYSTAVVQRSSENQCLRVPVVSAFGTPGTAEYSVHSALCIPGNRQRIRTLKVISAFGTVYSTDSRVLSHFSFWYSRESFHMTGTRESLTEY